MTQITLDSEQVLAIASQIETDNGKLQTLLNESKAAIDTACQNWQGKASEDTRAAYESFATQYFQKYYDILDQYVKFLRSNVAEQYSQAEQLNTQLADAFK